jgi:hypothetical protein
LSNLPADYDLRLYNSAGTLLYSSENGGTTSETITYNNAPVATYYIRVVGYNGAFSSSACYRVNAGISSTAFKLDMSGENEEVINESLETTISLFPNPSTDGRFTCYLTNDLTGEVNMQVYDAAGRVIETRSMDKTEQFMKMDIDLSNSERGMYYVKIYNENFQQTAKIVFAE